MYDLSIKLRNITKIDLSLLRIENGSLVINPQRMCEGYSTHCVCLCVCVCVCVSLSTMEATLIYSANNGHQWTANDILFTLKKMKTCKSAPSIQKQLSKLTALCTVLAMATPTY